MNDEAADSTRNYKINIKWLKSKLLILLIHRVS